MSEPCQTCAFRSGCETHDHESHNRLASEICAYTAIPFYCHDTDPNWRTRKRDGLTRAEHRELCQTLPICEGWRRRVAELNREGLFAKGVRTIRRYLGQRALELIKELPSLGFPEDRTDCLKELGNIVMMLTKRRRKKRNEKRATAPSTDRAPAV